MRYLLLLPLLLFVPTLASAKDEAAGKDPDAIRCRTIREVSSRIPKRECKTNAEWERAAVEARKAMAERSRASRCSDRC